MPGLIVMTLSDGMEPDLDRHLRAIVVLINANDEAQSFTAQVLAGKKLILHRVQRTSVDPVVRRSRFNRTSGTFTIPARTTAVFVEYEQAQVRIGHLIEDVQQLVFSGSLNMVQGNSLIENLEAAIQALDAGNPTGAINKLGAFILEVFSDILGGVLTPQDGLPLINTAKDIMWQIRADA